MTAHLVGCRARPSAVHMVTRVSLAALVCMTSSVASAQSQVQTPVPAPGPQSRVNGPFSRLFGAGEQTANSQSLQLRASLFGAQQSIRVPEEDQSQLDPRFRESQLFAGSSVSMAYLLSRTSGPRSLSIGGGGYLTEYSVQPTQPQYGSYANFSISTPLTRRISFASSAQLTHGVVYQFSPFLAFNAPAGRNPGVEIVPGGSTTGLTPGLNLAGLNQSAIDGYGQAAIRAQIARRTAVSVGLWMRRTEFLGEGIPDFGTVSSLATFTHQVYRRITVTLSYRREQQYISSSEFPESPPISSFDGMVNYGDALSLRLSRRTTLSMNVSAGSARSYRGRTEYRLLGGAVLNHVLRRSWSSGLTYNRMLSFSAAFREPILQDTVGGYLGGQLSRRVNFTSGLTMARGYIGLDSSRHFDTVNGSSALQLAFTRRLGAFTQYSYYHLSTPPNSSTLPLLSNYRGHSAVVGLNLFAPLYNNPRVRQ